MEADNNQPTWVEVYRTIDATRVALVGSLLDSEGIDVQINRETVNQVFGGVFDVSFLVPEGQQEHAVEVLRSAGYVPAEEGETIDAVVMRGKRGKPLSLNKLIKIVLLLIIVILGIAMYTFQLTR